MKKAAAMESLFRKIFHRKPLVVRSPGRVNLIGEHTDYNEGFVLPAAIDKAVILAVDGRNDSKCRFFASDLNDRFEFDLSDIQPSDKTWPNYLLGVVDQLKKAGFSLRGFDCLFGGDIPIGAGLSSSAALETGLAFALNEIFGLGIDKIDLVKMAQKAENEFVGVRCGIMDQFVNIFGAAGRVLKLDCRTLEHEYLPFDPEDLRVILCDTRVRHSLASSEYNIRREQCETGVLFFQALYPEMRSLRDVSADRLEAHKDEMAPLIHRRCRYVVDENNRLLQACEDLKRNDFISFGRKMFETHAGLRDDYAVSCPELDLLVETAEKCGAVLGARMMGGGFGGCTINLVEEEGLDEFIHETEKEYHARWGLKLKVYDVKVSEGTSVISP